jgi:AcrR family transcriptional regulator
LSTEQTFSTILNMRSAVRRNRDGTGGGGREAILSATIDLVGRRGAAGTSVRAVAEAASVSPALVIHHFGSKDGLLRACDARVQAVIERVVDTIAEHPDDLSPQTLLAVPDAGPSLGYVARSLQTGGDVGRWWFTRMADLSDELLARLTAAGSARPLADPEMAALLLLAMDLGLLLLRPLVEERLGADLADAAVLERWARAEVDLLANGLLAEPGKDAR